MDVVMIYFYSKRFRFALIKGQQYLKKMYEINCDD